MNKRNFILILLFCTLYTVATVAQTEPQAMPRRLTMEQTVRMAQEQSIIRMVNFK